MTYYPSLDISTPAKAHDNYDPIIVIIVQGKAPDMNAYIKLVKITDFDWDRLVVNTLEIEPFSIFETEFVLKTAICSKNRYSFLRADSSEADH